MICAFLFPPLKLRKNFQICKFFGKKMQIFFRGKKRAILDVREPLYLQGLEAQNAKFFQKNLQMSKKCCNFAVDFVI